MILLSWFALQLYVTGYYRLAVPSTARRGIKEKINNPIYSTISITKEQVLLSSTIHRCSKDPDMT